MAAWGSGRFLRLHVSTGESREVLCRYAFASCRITNSNQARAKICFFSRFSPAHSTQLQRELAFAAS